MTAKSETWFTDAIASGMNRAVADLGRSVIDSWEQFWDHSISEANLAEMQKFGRECPEAASHRWSLLGGPCPWFVHDEREAELVRANPKYSAMDILDEQNRQKNS